MSVSCAQLENFINKGNGAGAGGYCYFRDREGGGIHQPNFISHNIVTSVGFLQLCEGK